MSAAADLDTVDREPLAVALAALRTRLHVLDVTDPFASPFQIGAYCVDVDAELPPPTASVDVLADIAAALDGAAYLRVGDLLPALVARDPDTYAGWSTRHVAAALREHRIHPDQLSPGVRVIHASDIEHARRCARSRTGRPAWKD
ncbi:MULTISPECIES: hypothetical protein [Protofrankia]|uniref:Uncharacterized protein n=1 Tax=Candidatus Protofrankia datiscae TaxID=2716812 RepID=F8AVN3_9ACTN|nr:MULTISPECIES: hypothetical protein [Protofrankia]AEH11002.1 hypothetical protein FsymDg_3725 [Candidatus Protofrankia datiscae]